MPAAVAVIIAGFTLIYQALTGKSMAEVFGEVTGGILDPKGGSMNTAGTPVAPGGAASGPFSPSTGGLPGVQQGTTIIDGKPVANWIAQIVLWARQHGWRGRVTSGVRTDAEQSQACINVCGNPNGCPGRCAAPGQSNHRGVTFPDGAVDVSEPAQFAQVIANYPGGVPLRNDLPNDRVHFSRTGK